MLAYQEFRKVLMEDPLQTFLAFKTDERIAIFINQMDGATQTRLQFHLTAVTVRLMVCICPQT